MIFRPFLLLLFFLFIPSTFWFSDVEHSWYKESIRELEKQWVISGYEDGRFWPDDTVSRAEILKIILNASEIGVEEPEEQCFIDVNISEWQAKYICSGVKEGIAKWYEDGTFRQWNDVTILETLAFSVRAFDIDLPELSESDAWYERYRDFAHDNKIIPEHAYTTDTYASRGEAANIVYRMQQFDKWEELDYLSDGCGVSDIFQSGKYTLDINGLEREYLLYVPSWTNSKVPKPLIITFHGRTNDNEMVRDYMKLGGGSYGSTKNQKDFIVAYPAWMWAWPYSWSEYENIEFFDGLVTHLSENLCIDRDAVFSVGHSLGSYMSNKVSCLRWDVLRGMVGVASDGYNGVCTAPVTSLITHLPGDHLATYQWWLNAYSYKSDQNSCSEEEEEIELWDIQSCVQKTNCSSGNTVIFCNSYTGYWNDPHSWPKEGSDDILDFLRDINL